MGTHATFQINAQGGADFNGGGSDNVKIRSFEVTLERVFPKTTEHETQSTAMPEPWEDGEVKVSFKITPRSYENDTFFDAWEGLASPTLYKARIKFLCPFTPSGGSAPYLKLDFPICFVSKNPEVNVPGPGRVPLSVEFECNAPNDTGAAAPTGMTCVGPVEAFVLDARATAFLT
jgi:hypothetical protein